MITITILLGIERKDFLCLDTLRLRGCMPGVARRLLTFFASPKKVSKERRPQDAALRVPVKAMGQAGSETNSLRSNMFRFFIRLTHCFHGSVSSGGTSKPRNAIPLSINSISRTFKRLFGLHRIGLLTYSRAY